jgi:hypothetical protein
MVEVSWKEMKSILKKRMVKGAFFFGITLQSLIGSLVLAYSREPESKDEIIQAIQSEYERPHGICFSRRCEAGKTADRESNPGRLNLLL